MSVILTLVCLINSIYYHYYSSFASVALLSNLVYAKDVGDAIFENVLKPVDLIYVWCPLAVYLSYYFLNKKKYFTKELKSNKKLILSSVITALSFWVLAVIIMPLSAWGGFYKLWNRESVVINYGIYIYQIDDIIQSISPKINSAFGHDAALKETKDYYDNHEYKKTKNEYTNIFEGKNVIVIHAESMQEFVMELKFNNKEVTPNLNRLSKEGIFFSNFYSQVGVGTSSDAEFTFNTSLMPSTKGTVFVNFFDREYISIPKLLKEKGYYTYSMHANTGEFWNRNIMYNSLGYQKFYNYESDYTIDEIIGLGLSDESFFRQSLTKLKEINEKGQNFYGTLITLSNHTPFTNEGKDLSNFDVSSYHYDKNGKLITDNYLEGTILGSYIKSVHYADKALGEFIDGLEKEGLLENTVLIIYGDHDAKIKKSQFEYFYNYDRKTGKVIEKDSIDYKIIDDIDYELLRSVPFIIYSKDIEPKVISKVSSMLDTFPTIANMFGFETKYTLGSDIFDDKDNIVVFPNGNWLTDKMYYDTKRDSFKALEDNLVVKNDYIEQNNLIAQNKINISNYIIMYDLIRKNEEATISLKEK